MTWQSDWPAICAFAALVVGAVSLAVSRALALWRIRGGGAG